MKIEILETNYYRGHPRLRRLLEDIEWHPTTHGVRHAGELNHYKSALWAAPLLRIIAGVK